MAINSMNKGRDFERLMAKQFSWWWDHTYSSVTRVPLSGGYPRGRTWGDLICNNSVFFPLLISLKKVESWSLDQLFFNYSKSSIVVWLKEIQDIFYRYTSQQKWIESRYILLPVLVVAKNRYKPLIVMHIHDIDRLKPHIIGKILSENPHILKLYDLRICILDLFFQITKEILIKEKLFQDSLILDIYNGIYRVEQKYIKTVMNKEMGIINKEE